MKIVMICNLYDEKVQYQDNLLAKYYVKHGHDVTVIAPTFDDVMDFFAGRYDRRKPAREYRDGQVKVVKVPFSLNVLNKLRKLRGVGTILAREQPDLIFVHGVHSNLLDAAAYKRSHPECRVIMDEHNDYTNSASNWLSLRILHGVIRRRLLQHTKWSLDKIFPVVPTSAVFLNEVYGVPHSEMDLLPLGADGDLAKQVRHRKEGAAIRRSLGIPADAIVVFTGGKLGPAKKTDLLIEALQRLDDPRVHLLIVGESEDRHAAYKDRLLKLAEGDSRVHFTGWVAAQDVYKYMDASDFAVFPGTQSVLWQQALSMGLPLIVTAETERGAQDPSYLNLYDNVAVVPNGKLTAEELARRIAELVNDPILLKRRQEGALRASEEVFNYDAIVAETLKA